MQQLRCLPFKVGDRVESKSFQSGFRSAWFRCEIKKTGGRGVGLDYFDYPDQKLTWMRSLFQKLPSKSKGAKVELMLRPQFPPVYCEGEAPDVNTLSEVVVVRNGVWKVGDLVDWFTDGAFWSGTITELKGDDKVQLELPPPPVGEGSVYEACCKDLRPSLEWSRVSGWKVSIPKDNKSYTPCARLIEPLNQGKLGNEGKNNSEAAATKESPSVLNASASHSSAQKDTAVPPQAQGEKRNVDTKGSCSDSLSSTYVRASEENAPENDEASKRIQLSKHIPLNSSSCDSIESLIVDMEELLNRVKWMKGILEPPESDIPGWKFQEYRAG